MATKRRSMTPKSTTPPHSIVVISDYPVQRQRLITLLSPSVHYATLPDIEEIQRWPNGQIVIMDYKPSAARQLAQDIEVIKQCHLGVLVLVVVKPGDTKTENAAIKANADEMIKRPFSNNHLVFALKHLSARFTIAGTVTMPWYRPAGVDQRHNTVLGLLDATGRIRPFRALELDIYSYALEHHHHNQDAVAKSLKIARSTWYRRARKLGLVSTKETSPSA